VFFAHHITCCATHTFFFCCVHTSQSVHEKMARPLFGLGIFRPTYIYLYFFNFMLMLSLVGSCARQVCLYV
jgi:hypothetical protein